MILSLIATVKNNLTDHVIHGIYTPVNHVLQGKSMERDNGGKFTAKGDEPRKVRSFRLADSTYEAISGVAESLDMSKGDYLEKLNDDGVFTDSNNKTSVENVQETFNSVIHGLLEDLYDENELEIVSKDKAAVKRCLEKILANLDEVIGKYQ